MSTCLLVRFLVLCLERGSLGMLHSAARPPASFPSYDIRLQYENWNVEGSPLSSWLWLLVFLLYFIILDWILVCTHCELALWCFCLLSCMCRRSNLWLGPFGTLVMVFLAVFISLTSVQMSLLGSPTDFQLKSVYGFFSVKTCTVYMQYCAKVLENLPLSGQ